MEALIGGSFRSSVTAQAPSSSCYVFIAATVPGAASRVLSAHRSTEAGTTVAVAAHPVARIPYRGAHGLLTDSSF